MAAINRSSFPTSSERMCFLNIGRLLCPVEYIEESNPLLRQQSTCQPKDPIGVAITHLETKWFYWKLTYLVPFSGRSCDICRHRKTSRFGTVCGPCAGHRMRTTMTDVLSSPPEALAATTSSLAAALGSGLTVKMSR